MKETSLLLWLLFGADIFSLRIYTMLKLFLLFGVKHLSGLFLTSIYSIFKNKIYKYFVEIYAVLAGRYCL